MIVAEDAPALWVPSSRNGHGFCSNRRISSAGRSSVVDCDLFAHLPSVDEGRSPLPHSCPVRSRPRRPFWFLSKLTNSCRSTARPGQTVVGLQETTGCRQPSVKRALLQVLRQFNKRCPANWSLETDKAWAQRSGLTPLCRQPHTVPGLDSLLVQPPSADLSRR